MSHDNQVDSFQAIRTQTIARLNDECRKARIHVSSRLIMTPGITGLDSEDISLIWEKVRKYNLFTVDNDPYGEHDFGSFRHNDQKIFWKIDYYDLDLTYASEDPSDEGKTTRVLTIMLASEY